MYAALLKAHVGFAVLALLLTLGWGAMVAAKTAGSGRSFRLVYVGATASILNDGSSNPYRLMLTSNQLGVAGALTATSATGCRPG